MQGKEKHEKGTQLLCHKMQKGRKEKYYSKRKKAT